MNITIDISDFKKKLETFSEKENEKFIRKTINDILFSVRNYAIKDSKGMASEFTIRNKGLVKKHIRVKKAFGITGYFGSVKSNRFSGWVEQQYGKRTKREIKVHTRNARGSSGKRKLAARYRRNYSGIKNMLDSRISNMTGSYTQMIAANLAMLRRKKESGPIKIPVQFGKRKPGIYNLLKSGKTKVMEIFETKQPKKNTWATDIILRYIATGQAEKIVIKNIEKVLKKQNA
jgi:hypothetical protein